MRGSRKAMVVTVSSSRAGARAHPPSMTGGARLSYREDGER